MDPGEVCGEGSSGKLEKLLLGNAKFTLAQAWKHPETEVLMVVSSYTSRHIASCYFPRTCHLLLVSAERDPIQEVVGPSDESITERRVSEFPELEV